MQQGALHRCSSLGVMRKKSFQGRMWQQEVGHILGIDQNVKYIRKQWESDFLLCEKGGNTIKKISK